MNTTNGKIAEQSKQKIMEALLSVMEQYDYKEITITQISQEAELSRKTFYRLFPDKEAVLKLYFEGLFTECLTQIKAQDIHHYWEVVQMYFDFWESKKDILLLFKKNALLPFLFECVYEHSSDVFAYVRSTETVNTFSRQLPYLLAYAVGGMHSMLLKWVENDMVIPSSELIQSLKKGLMSPDI
ncbi:MAG: TetR/AcrR family transcriptional regulator [Lachnospiraceae bacterium]|nr:TetR/AcrR family transcriptional regulator [Lachnospiraceae bacterium]